MDSSATPQTVLIEAGDNKNQIFGKLLTGSSLLAKLDEQCKNSGKTKEDFHIVIKPDIEGLGTNTYRYTDPELVHQLATFIATQGFPHVRVVATAREASSSSSSLQRLAEHSNYATQPTMLNDIAQQKEDFDYGSILGVAQVYSDWKNADFRISFAKNKTDKKYFYSGCIENVYSCFADGADILKRNPHLRYAEACLLFADRHPIHYGFVDAWRSCDNRSNDKPTQSVMASESIFALDWVMGEKMDVNPALNPIIQEALHRWGRISIRRKGNQTEWLDWKNASEIMVALYQLFE